MPMTAYWRKKTGDHAIGKTTIGTMVDLWMGLFKTDPGDSGAQSGEVTGTGYARVNVTALFGAFDATTGIAVNTAEISFGSPGSDWGPGAYAGFLDASTGGNMRYKEAIPNPRYMSANSRAVRFAAGKVKIRHI